MSAETTAPLSAPGIVLTTPYAAVHIAQDDLIDHAVMRARQVSALLMTMQDDGKGPDDMTWLAQQLADELVTTVMGIAGLGLVEVGKC